MLSRHGRATRATMPHREHCRPSADFLRRPLRGPSIGPKTRKIEKRDAANPVPAARKPLANAAAPSFFFKKHRDMAQAARMPAALWLELHFFLLADAERRGKTAAMMSSALLAH
nr:hypothetical protein [Pandoravirus massiliensis]